MLNEPSSPFDDAPPQGIPEGLLALTPKAKHREEFKTFDPRQLSTFDDKKLVLWQSEYEMDEPQWMLAADERQRRAGKTTRRIAIAALIVSILSLILSLLRH
jgi:hypothetical protein